MHPEISTPPVQRKKWIVCFFFFFLLLEVGSDDLCLQKWRRKILGDGVSSTCISLYFFFSFSKCEKVSVSSYGHKQVPLFRQSTYRVCQHFLKVSCDFDNTAVLSMYCPPWRWKSGWKWGSSREPNTWWLDYCHIALQINHSCDGGPLLYRHSQF